MTVTLGLLGDINIDIAMNLTRDVLDDYVPTFIQNLQVRKIFCNEKKFTKISLLEDKIEQT